MGTFCVHTYDLARAEHYHFAALVFAPVVPAKQEQTKF